MTAPDHFADAELNILRRRGPSTYDLFLITKISQSTTGGAAVAGSCGPAMGLQDSQRKNQRQRETESWYVARLIKHFIRFG
jgi:hypothetical protein